MIYSFVGLILKIWIQSAAYLSYESVLNDKYQYIYWYIVLSIYEYNIYHAKQLLGWYLSISWYGQFLRWCNGYISDSLGYANQYPFRIITTHHGDNLLDQAVCFGKFFWCFSWGFQINMRQTGENHLGSSFFRILGCQKCCFHEIRRSNITAFRRSLHQILCAAFLGPPCPPCRSLDQIKPLPWSYEQTSISSIFGSLPAHFHPFRAPSRNISSFPIFHHFSRLFGTTRVTRAPRVLASGRSLAFK